MAQRRLANYDREAMLTKLLDYKFKALEKAWDEKETAFGEKFYKFLYPEALRKKMEALPPGFLPESDSVSIRIEGGSKNYTRVYFKRKRFISSEHKSNAARVLTLSDEIAREYEALIAEEEALKREKDEARSKAKAILYSCRTYEKLIATWPEAEKLLKPWGKQPERATSTALALPITAANQAFGLPPK